MGKNVMNMVLNVRKTEIQEKLSEDIAANYLKRDKNRIQLKAQKDAGMS